MKKPAAAKRVRGLSLRDYISQAVDDHTLSTLAKASGVSYTCLYRHVTKGDDLRASTAKKLEAWSGGKINAAKTLGVDT